MSEEACETRRMGWVDLLVPEIRNILGAPEHDPDSEARAVANHSLDTCVNVCMRRALDVSARIKVTSRKQCRMRQEKIGCWRDGERSVFYRSVCIRRRDD